MRTAMLVSMMLLTSLGLMAGQILYSNVNPDSFWPEFSQTGAGIILDQVIVTQDRSDREKLSIGGLHFGVDVFSQEPVQVSAWYAPMQDDGTPLMPILIGTRIMSGITGLQTVRFGDGLTELFLAQGNSVAVSADYPGARAFYVGLSFSSPTDVGWRVADGPTPGNTPDSFWLYDPPSIDGLVYLGGSPRASFMLEVEGAAIPEPNTISMLSCGCSFLAIAAICRRRVTSK